MCRMVSMYNVDYLDAYGKVHWRKKQTLVKWHHCGFFFHPFGWVTHAPFGFYWNTTWEYWGIMWYSNMGMFCLRPRSSQEIGRQWVAEESAGSSTKLLVQEKFPYLNVIYKVENMNRLRSNITDGSIWKNKVIWMCLFPKVLEANWRLWTGNVELTL